jgi:hypothetical protein
MQAERWLAHHRLSIALSTPSDLRDDIDAWQVSYEGQEAGEDALKAIRTFLWFLVDMGYRVPSPAVAEPAPTQRDQHGTSLPPEMRTELWEWDVTHGLHPSAVAAHWLIVSVAERWMSSHGIVLCQATRRDVEAWDQAPDGNSLGEEGLEAVRTFLRFCEARGYRQHRSAPDPTRSAVAPVVELRERLEGSAG